MIYRFGDCELDEERSELRRGGAVVPLQPKPLGLLAFLVAHRDRVVSKDELLDSLWPGTAVTESSLTRAVSIARKAIGDDGRRSWIRSYSRRGYRFVGEVVELPAAAAEPAGPRTPPADTAAPARPDPFVGREPALAALDRAWTAAAGGAGRVVLLTGEPGIGKSRLAEVFAEGLRARGGRVLAGRAEESEGVPAFWMWVQVLRGLAAATDLRALAREVGASAGEVADLVPELAPAEGAPRLAGSAEESRFLLFDAVARILGAWSREGALALVLDDLQWASRPSLLLLEHLARELRRLPLLLIGTLREERREPGHPLTRTLSILGQLDHVEALALEGFSRDEVAALLARVIGRPAPERLVGELYARTEGNPLFLREALRLLADAGQLDYPELTPRWRLDQLPARTRDIVQRHLESLSADCLELLAAAAVLGREVRVATAAAVAGCSPSEALERIDEAVRAGVLEETGAAGGVRFAHPLFQEVTYESLGPGRRARLHLRAGEELERREDPEGALSDLARHHHQALGAADPEKAFAYAAAAAERARRAGAWDQAALHLEQALAALDATAPFSPERQLDLLLRLGEAQRFAGDRRRRREVLSLALQRASALDRPEDFARAAIGFCDLSEWGPVDVEADAVLDEALEQAGQEPGEIRARILTRLAYLARREPRSEPVAREAVALARELGDPDPLHEALYTLHLILSGPDHLDERAELVNELCGVVPKASYRDLAVIGRVDLASDRVTEGRRADALRERDEAGALAGPRPHRGMLWHLQLFDAGWAHLEGRFDEAESLARETFLLGQMIEHPWAPIIFLGQSLLLLRDRGDLDGLAAQIGPRPPDPGEQVRLGPAAASLIASLNADVGRVDDARRLFDAFAAADFREIPRGIDWTSTVVALARTCAALGDQRRARLLYEMLEPHPELHAVVPVPIMYDGPFTHALGLLMLTLDEPTRAREHLEDALDQCEALGARPAAARVRLELGRLRLRRGDRRPGESLLREARSAAEALGMAGLAAAARQELGSTAA